MLDKEILIVDDDENLRAMIRSVFESAGYTQVTAAASGEEALALMAKKNARHRPVGRDDAGHGRV